MRNVVLFISTILIISCKRDNAIKVATSANMQYVMLEMIENYQLSCNCKVDLITSSSGKLTTQIEQGAPFDIFVSADTIYPQYLYDKKITHHLPIKYAKGQLVLWSATQKKYQLNDLTNHTVKKIAIANPKNAPYGKAAIQVLKQLKIYDLVKPKLVYGESISQVNQFIQSKSVDVGFTALSVIKSPKIKLQNNWILVDETLYQPILHSIIIVSKKQPSNQVKNFFDYLLSKECKLILKKYGYLIPNE